MKGGVLMLKLINKIKNKKGQSI